MPKQTLTLLLLVLSVTGFTQQKLDKLTVEKIMRDQKWVGASPSNPYWSYDGKYLFFSWNPDNTASDSLYFISSSNHTPQKTTYSFRQEILRENDVQFNVTKKSYVYIKDGDVFMGDVKTGRQKRVTQTAEAETNPQFSFSDTRIVYTSNSNLYSWDIATGAITQLTNFQAMAPTVPTGTTGPASLQRGNPVNRGTRGAVTTGNQQEVWLKENAIENSDVLKTRKQKRDLADSMRKLIPETKKLRVINIEDKTLFGAAISPDGRFITYRLLKPAAGGKNTIVPSYVTESGFTEEIPGRTKVGAPQGTQELFVFDSKADTVFALKTDSIKGIKDLPAYLKDYPQQLAEKSKRPVNRQVSYNGPSWSPMGKHAVIDIRSQDNKDRWLMLLDTQTADLQLLDRQHDDAWIDGPGINIRSTGWIDENTFWFQSEVTGYSHLYTFNVTTGEKKALTSGNFEVQQARLSKDCKYFYITTNEVHPGEQQLYRLPSKGGTPERITTLTGSNQAILSPDEKNISILYSYTNKPWELYLQGNTPAGKQSKAEQITSKAQSDEFRSYPWKDPEIITFKARDGATVYARLYKPTSSDAHKPAVVFVHGAGYLQNAHKWWSSYSREYMFNNMLADNGYFVLDIDYRGSAGYGRDWRTGIYRHMGGKDLYDNIDGLDYLVKNFGIDPKRAGLYGGSYGGFITLMALFTTPDAFTAGAALRPVTDWAHYNHGYTANILNEPFNDSIAYHQSSPIYFADGLKGHLLICHGMVDVNVNFQDAVRLSQRLIELGKDNWELAPYPLEDHGFVEPSSWTDEYKRIFKLFETELKR